MRKMDPIVDSSAAPRSAGLDGGRMDAMDAVDGAWPGAGDISGRDSRLDSMPYAKRGGVARVLGALGVFGVCLVPAIWFGVRALHDPLRTLAAFPVDGYLEGYKALEGIRFRADLRVEADLGYQAGKGRLMLFGADGDARPFAALVDEAVAKEAVFAKGQVYTGEVEVSEGGLVLVHKMRKR